MSRQPCDQACQRTSIPVKNGRAEAPNLLRLSNNLGSLMRIPTTKSKPAPEKAATHVMARSRFPVWLPAVLLVLVTIALYWPATHHDFVQYDDNQYILDNTHVTGGLTLENARWAFRTGYAANWHPVTWLSHMADCQLFGLNPWGHHLTNLLFHALNAALVFVLLQQLSGAVWRSLFVAALFALHPLRVESVAWVAERKDVLSGFFGLLSLVLYARYAGKSVIGNQLSVTSGQASGMAAAHKASRITLPASLFYVLSLCCFACGLMSKPMLVTWPFVMLLLDYWPLRRFEPSTPNSRLSTVLRLVMEKLPFFALSAVASVVTFAVQKNAGAVRTVEHLPLGARGENAVISYVRYLAKLFWPTDLAVFYPLPTHWPMAEVLLAGWVDTRHFGGSIREAGAISFSADRVAVVCGNAGARDRFGASGRTVDGGSLYLYSVAWGADPHRLGYASTDQTLAVPCNCVGGGGGNGNRPVLRVDAATARALEGDCNPFPACARSHEGQPHRAQLPRRRSLQEPWHRPLSKRQQRGGH